MTLTRAAHIRLAGLLACTVLLGPPVRAQAPQELWDYVIGDGDTLVGVHAKLMRPDADWRVVQSLNRIANPHRLQPGTTLRIPVALLREDPAGAEVLHAHGEVFVERPGGAREPLRAAAMVRGGDLIVTGAQSSASLRFADGSRALLGPLGRLRVERLVKRGGSGTVDTRLRLDGGSMETRVQPARPAPRFDLRTPVANLGVRGTDFRARLDGDHMLAEVLEGKVALGSQGVDAGFGTLATPGRVVPPRALLAPPDLSGVATRVERLQLQFSFPPLAGALQYRAQVFDSGEPPTLLLDGLFDRARIAWPDAPPDGRYELRVRAADDLGIEGLPARLAITVKARPEPPLQLRPRAGDKVFEERVGFAWTGHPEAAGYRLQVAAQPDFAAPVLDRRDIGATELTEALPPGTWYWRLASVRAGGDAGPWGDASLLLRAERPPPPPSPPVQAPQASDAGLAVRWAAVPTPGVRYQVQVARDAAFTDLVVDETTEATERLLPKPAPGTYHLRVRTVGSDGRAGAFGATQVMEVPRSLWWLWLLPLLLAL